METLDEQTFPRAENAPADGGWLVLKFGGTSIASAEKWQIIRDLIRERIAAGYRVVVVHSALADVSNRLEAALDLAVGGEHEPALAGIFSLYYELADALELDGKELLARHIEELTQLMAGIRLVREVSSRVQVKVLALGELMATRLGAAWLRSQQLTVTSVDARDVLCSIPAAHDGERSRYLAARCDFEADPTLQSRFAAEPGVILTQGFIARNPKGESVLLGRGGSDTSAAYFAAKLQAAGLEIWTDVPGIFSANPRSVPGARLLQRVSYEEAQEIASTGGSVLHPASISPVRRFGIPLRVRCTTQPELPGTLITGDSGSDAPRVKAIAGRSGITLISMETGGMWREVGFLADAFSCFRQHGLSIDLVSTSERNVTVTLDTGVQAVDADVLARLRSSLEAICRVHVIENAEVVSLVGRKIRAILHEIGPALEVFEEHQIHLVSLSATDLNLSFVVEEGQAHRLIQKLHSTLVQASVKDPVFGATWEELQQDETAEREIPVPWWAKKRDRLLEIARTESSAYVYDLDSVAQAAARLSSLKTVDQVFYAVKANSHPDILRTIFKAGLNFECVSPGELRRIFELFPGIDRQRILFTPNFAPRHEYEFAVAQGVRITLDNLHPLRHWGEVFSGQELMLRLDTGQGRGHHEHVRTAGVHSKFGVPLFELDEARELVERCGASVAGLHAHIGSGILKADNWQEVARALLSVAADFPAVRILNLGGGLGVPEKPGQHALDMALLGESLGDIRSRSPDIELWLEPGRYLVAEAGVLLAEVTQLKGKGEVHYVGISTGMNSLIRPALYGAYHEIVNLSRLGDAAEQVVNIVGPNCETGDRLGSDRLLPPCQEGDVLAIANTGAYGFVMSSRYNLREPATEITI